MIQTTRSLKVSTDSLIFHFTKSTLILQSIILCVLFTGCMQKDHQEDSVEKYLAILRENPSAPLPPQKESEALDRIKTFLSNLREDYILNHASKVYTPDAFFNDTLKTVIGAKNIENYLLETARNTDEIRVEILDTSSSGADYYLRWVMDVKFKKFHRGRSFRTIGITHIRFSQDGLVSLHQDYWDSARGLYEQIPILGSGIRAIRRMF